MVSRRWHNYIQESVRYPSTKKTSLISEQRFNSCFVEGTVDDISHGIGSVDISDGGIAAAAVACDMSSGEEDTISEKKCTSYKTGAMKFLGWSRWELKIEK